MKFFGGMKRSSLVIILLIIILAFLLGSRIILAGDFYFLYDQARDLMLVKSIGIDHKLTLIGSRSGIGGFFHGPLYLYLLLPIFFLGGGDPFAFTTLYIVIGIATVLAGFVVGKKLYNEWIGILVAFFLAISPRVWGYVSSTQGLNLIPLIYLGLFYSLVLYFRGKRKMFLWAVLFTGITFQFETATSLILVPIVGLLYFLLPGAYKQWKLMIGSICIFGLSMSTFLLFDIRHQFLMTKSAISYIRYGEKGEGYMPFFQRLGTHFNGLLGTYQSVLIENTLLLQVLLLLIIVFALITIIRDKIKSQLKKELLLFGLFPIVTFAFLLLYPRSVFQEYVLGLTIPAAFFTSICLSLIWKKQSGKILGGIFILLLLIGSFQLLYLQYTSAYKNTTAGSYKNQKAVVDWIFKDAGERKFGYFVYTPEVFTSGMDYLFWWEGTEIYNNPPINAKQEITYLVMYPPLQYDYGAHAYWKKNVIRTRGKVVTTKSFTGKIIVEKLQIPPDDPAPDPNYYQNLIFR